MLRLTAEWFYFLITSSLYNTAVVYSLSHAITALSELYLHIRSSSPSILKTTVLDNQRDSCGAASVKVEL